MFLSELQMATSIPILGISVSNLVQQHLRTWYWQIWGTMLILIPVGLYYCLPSPIWNRWRWTQKVSDFTESKCVSLATSRSQQMTKRKKYVKYTAILLLAYLVARRFSLWKRGQFYFTLMFSGESIILAPEKIKKSKKDQRAY